MPRFPIGLNEEELRIYRNKQRKKNYQDGITWEHHYREWTEKEIKMVMAHEIPDRVLAKKLLRSIQAIQAMRCKENKRSGKM